MGYKLLGYVVWHGGKFFVRRRYSGPGRKVAIAGLAGGLFVGGLLVARASRSGDS